MRAWKNIGWAAVFLAGVALPSAAQEGAIPDVVERVTPAVVSIYASRDGVPPEGDFFFRPPRFREQGMGSGVLVSSDGLILTNNHVVDRAGDVRVVHTDRREFKAKLLGADRKTDLALLKIDAKDLAFLTFGDSSKVRIGETVLAIGNPLGVGQTVSKGIVSAKGRANVGIVDYEDFLQTDAAINPGNSGGALVNLRGELIGINTAIASRTGGFQGIGFAIPSDMAREVLEILRKDGKVSRGQMGVVVQDMTPPLARAMDGAPDRGALVSEVQDGSPAAKAGLKRGDIIVKVDGAPIVSTSQLRNRVALKGGGATVRLEVWREGKSLDLAVTLRKEEEKAPPIAQPRESDEEEEGEDSGLAGVTVTPLTPSLARRLGLPKGTEGLLVSSVDPSRISPWLGLREGDVILEINRKTVRSAEEMKDSIRETRDAVLLTIRRQGVTLYVAVPKDRAGGREE